MSATGSAIQHSLHGARTTDCGLSLKVAAIGRPLTLQAAAAAGFRPESSAAAISASSLPLLVLLPTKKLITMPAEPLTRLSNHGQSVDAGENRLLGDH
jgi:hypothetical protein